MGTRYIIGGWYYANNVPRGLGFRCQWCGAERQRMCYVSRAPYDPRQPERSLSWLWCEECCAEMGAQPVRNSAWDFLEGMVAQGSGRSGA